MKTLLLVNTLRRFVKVAALVVGLITLCGCANKSAVSSKTFPEWGIEFIARNKGYSVCIYPPIGKGRSIKSNSSAKDLIVPGREAFGLRLGTPEKELKQLCDMHSGVMETAFKDTAYYIQLKNGHIVFVRIVNQRVEQIVVDNQPFVTPEGITNASSWEQVLRKYDNESR